MSNPILSMYPKERAALPPEYQAIYEKHFYENRTGQYKTTAIAQGIEAWMHRQVAADLTDKHQASTLEIGAGTLNQLPFEPPVGPYDIIEPRRSIYEHAPGRERVRHCFADISEAHNCGPYDRITTIAVFEHIMDLPAVVAHSAVLLNPNGSLRVAIPNEGTPLWKLCTLITGYEFTRKYKLDYDVIMRFEHVNTAHEIEQVLSVFFESVRCKVLGLSKNLALYRFYECTKPRLDMAQQFLTQR